MTVAVSLAAAAPAQAASNPPGSVSVGGNSYYAYVGEGESLDVVFTKTNNSSSSVKMRVTDPSGVVHVDCDSTSAQGVGTTCAATGLTGPQGVWLIEQVPLTGIATGTFLKPATTNTRFAFDITVRGENSAEVPGRVWTDTFMGFDSATAQDLDFWVVTEFGAVYSFSLRGFSGGGWNIQADAFGIVDAGTCNPLYHSTAMTSNVARYNNAPLSCGDKYWLFFEAPAPDLPKTSTSADGDLWIMPDVVTPAVDSLAFTPASPASAAGTFTYDLVNFTGGYTLQIDVDGDGSYDGPRDRSIVLGGSGTQSYVWDGRDALGDPVDPYSTTIHAQIAIDKTDEFHIVLADVEGLAGGMTLTQLRGNSPGNTMIYWDDTQIPTDGKTSITDPVDGTAGVDSSGGAHAWAGRYSTGGFFWGDYAAIDSWTYSPVDIRASITLVQPRLELTKTSDATAETRVGDTVNYTVTATNTGSGDYTAENPAVVFDDLSGVLDDATYNGDASASVGAAPSYAEPLLSWTGPLAVGESVSLTYSTTVTAGGDGTARNIAWVPNDPENPAIPSCEAPVDGTDPVTGEPCAVAQFELPKLTIAKTADRTELPGVGESVEYTIEVTNVGPGDYTTDNPATFVDDLGDVLDDATFDGVASASAGTATFTAPELSWEGVLAAGESATITYTVTYTGEGDQSLVNVVCVPVSETAAGAESCARVTVPGARLTQWKSVESSDSPAVAGSVLTYTLHFGNDGSAAATVDAVDLLRHVLDDADVTAEPVASSGLTAVRDGETIVITGTVQPGAEATVVYEVTLKADGERGDDIAANYLLTNDPTNPPTTPTAPVCTPVNADQPNCTVTPIAAVTYAKSVTASSDPIATGTELTYTITVTSTGTATTPVSRDDVLADVLDDATLTAAPASDVASVTVGEIADGRFHIGGELAGGATATVTYRVTVNDASDRGNNTADNFLVPAGEEPPAECVAGSTDCTVTPLPAVSVTKSADPASGSEVAAGDEVTYTLTFVNTGEATGGADYTDDLSGVLDDADLTGQPVSSDTALTGVVTASDLRVTGTIEAGATTTVSYTVTVRADAEQGDHVLRNVIAITGTEPVCDVTAQTCTEHPIPPTPVPGGPTPTPTPTPVDGLAITGGTIAPWIIALLALLPIGAGVIALSRRRRARVEQD